MVKEIFLLLTKSTPVLGVAVDFRVFVDGRYDTKV